MIRNIKVWDGRLARPAKPYRLNEKFNPVVSKISFCRVPGGGLVT